MKTSMIAASMVVLSVLPYACRADKYIGLRAYQGGHIIFDRVGDADTQLPIIAAGCANLQDVTFLCSGESVERMALYVEKAFKERTRV